MSDDTSSTNTNPGNFANRPTEEVKAIASMGGKASHRGHDKSEDNKATTSGDAPPGRNPDGTFTKGSEAAKKAGQLGGLHSHNNDSKDEMKDEDSGRNPDGTFKRGSLAAKEARAASHKNDS